MNGLGKRMRKVREEKNLTQLQFSEMVGLSYQFYGDIERGTKSPSIEVFVKIANSLNVSSDYLLLDELIVTEGLSIKEVLNEVTETMQDLSKSNVIFIAEVVKTMVHNFTKSQQ